jgi:tetratricopeptide (TPR) repeat protein
MLRKVAGDEKNPEEKAYAYYRIGECQFEMKQYSQAQTNYNNAIKYNPEYGDAYYKLALCYEQIKFFREQIYDRYKFLLCIDKLTLAKECVARNATTSMRKYNRVSEAILNNRINELKQVCPTESEAFMLPADYRTPGKVIKFGKVGQTTVRFYSK